MNARPALASGSGGQTVEAAAPAAATTHNLFGQRLGRKGQDTRERIVRAMMILLDGEDHGACAAPVTLSAVAREAGVGMSTLYLYFADFGELLLAVLKRVTDSMVAPFLDRLCTYWPDETLEASCEAFVRSTFLFWQRHGPLLRMRNSLADARDQRFVEYRHNVSEPALERLAWQMNPPAGPAARDYEDCAIALFTGLERTATIVTLPDFVQVARLGDEDGRRAYIERLVRAEANVIHVVIRDMRARAPGAAGSSRGEHAGFEEERT